MKFFVAITLVCFLACSTDALAQARGRGAAKPPVKTTSLRVSVRDQAGASLDGVKLTLSGDATGEYTTAGAGTVVIPDMKDGTYRVRAERGGFITLEREFSVRAGGPLTAVDIVLSEAPPPPPPPKAPEPPPVVLPPPGSPVSVSIPDYLDRNFIGREPIKESILACKPSETVRLLQLRENVAQHAHDKMDEVIYVVAGEGTIRIGEETTPMKPGSLAVVPRGSAHAIERKGRTPLIVLSTLAGAPCQSPQ